MLWFEALGLLILGAMGGALATWLLRHYFGPSAKLRQELQETQQEAEAYRERVDEHFARTSALFQDVTEKYRTLHDHLAEGATTLTRGARQLPAADLPERAMLEDAIVSRVLDAARSSTVDNASATATAPEQPNEPPTEPAADDAQTDASNDQPPPETGTAQSSAEESPPPVDEGPEKEPEPSPEVALESAAEAPQRPEEQSAVEETQAADSEQSMDKQSDAEPARSPSPTPDLNQSAAAALPTDHRVVTPPADYVVSAPEEETTNEAQDGATPKSSARDTSA